jgi:fatty-acyl-CoA synthase
VSSRRADASGASPSYASGSSALPLLGETVGEKLRRITARWPVADALVDLAQGVRYTYLDFDRAVDDVARAMLGVGLAKGDRGAIWAPNGSQWVLLQ